MDSVGGLRVGEGVSRRRRVNAVHRIVVANAQIEASPNELKLVIRSMLAVASASARAMITIALAVSGSQPWKPFLKPDSAVAVFVPNTAAQLSDTNPPALWPIM